MTRICVASLSDYNAGILYGSWFTLNNYNDVEELQEAIQVMLEGSPSTARTGLPAEEWAIHDTEDMGKGLIDENSSLEDVWMHYEALSEHGEAWAEYAEHIGKTYATVEGFEEAYQGQHSSKNDFAYSLVDGLGYLDEMPEYLQNYFDYDALARDLFVTDYFMTEGGHVFRNC